MPKNLKLIPLVRVKGINKDVARKLATKLEIKTVFDLLFYLPRDYITYKRSKIGNLVADTNATVIGKLVSHDLTMPARNPRLTIQTWKIKDSTGTIICKRFYQNPYYRSPQWQNSQSELYQPGVTVAVQGTIKEDSYYRALVITSPEVTIIDRRNKAQIQEVKCSSRKPIPIYSLTEGIDNQAIGETMRQILKAAKCLVDPIPQEIREKYELIKINRAIANIHSPKSASALSSARRRLVFDEFFYLQLGFLKHRQQLRQVQNSAILAPTGRLIDQFNEIKPFKFTNAQNRVINDILNDLHSTTAMNRLVQGDVGSGKTVVAVVAILAAIQSGYQAALMAPTEVLAEQHYRKLEIWFNMLHLPVELLTGSTALAKRRQIHAQLETGELPLLVGTHALIQDPVNFKKLGLVVIDEQHRFGVHQRARLVSKGKQPHVLTMTATPIPRTLALTLHGDLDVSQIDELPPGRQPIKTTVLSENRRRHAYDLIRRQIAQGRQAYIVLPLVEESETLDLRSALQEHQRLKTSIFPEFKVGLLHGRMTSAEKDEAISAFRDNQTQILVSTTVVEVGVDVPNVTVMMIENAERFGLSQLHQLRGRVGRGCDRSYCLLMSSSTTTATRQRLNVLEQSQDGFFISEMDMRLRRPGEVLGTRQSGVANFALASLVEDQEVLELARNAAESIVGNLANYPLLEAELGRRGHLDSNHCPN